MIRASSFTLRKLAVMAVTPLMMAQFAFAAEKLDLSTHDSLIQKLESVVSIEGKDSMYNSSQLSLRLADLYAERARLLSLEKQGQGDQLYKAKITEDRTRAIKLYTQVLPSLKLQEKGRVLLQTAHLYLMLEQKEEAVKIYSSILKNARQHSKETLAAAQIQWADIMFYKGEFASALNLFRAASLIKENPRKGYALYRAAWCQYNLGKTKDAQDQLIALLKNKSMFFKETKIDKTKAKVLDVAFQEEVSRDLATFMARNDIVASDITTLSQLSPDSARQKNLLYLATELDRTAKKQSALLVWAVIGQHNVDFVSQLEGQIQITRIQYDLGNRDKVLVEIDRSIVLLKNPTCAKFADECTTAQQNLKKTITEWGKAEERAPTTQLILGFGKYTAAFDDAEMSYWTGHSSLKRKLYNEAFNAFSRSAHLFSKMDRSDARIARMFEGSLIGAIEAGETAESDTLKLGSYRLYLELNPKGPKRDEIKYQIAHVFYEADDFKNAADLFREIAVDTKAPATLREKSSELCLDADVILKNEPQIEADSLLFAQTFKARAPYFLSLWRKSILNQSAHIINHPAATQDQLEAQWKKLDPLALTQWPMGQKKTVIKNKLAIGLKIKNLEIVANASQQFLSLEQLSLDEQNWALGHAAWVAEMRMDFPAALRILKRITPSMKERAEHYFKVALLTELAHQDPTDEYSKFMSVSKDGQKNQYAAYQIINYSPAPKKSFSKYSHLLKQNPQLFASAGIITYEKSADISIARSVLANKHAKSTFESQILARSLELKSFEQLQRQFTGLPLSGRSDKTVQKNLVARIKLIKQLEKKSQEAIKRKDSSLQLILLSQVYHENSRLVQDILALPIPKQLDAAQKKFYQEQIQLQVKPYITQAIAVKEKVSELWDMAIKRAVFKDLFDLSEELSKPGSQLARAEIGKLMKAAEMSSLKENPFINFTRERHKVAAEATQLQKSIIKDPFNFNDIEKFKALQKALGHGPMVAYLESRIEGLQSRGGRE